MDIGRITLALALAAVAGLVTGELRAQEFDLPPAPSSSADPAFSAENGPCFYNAYSWSVRGQLNQTMIAAEMRDLAGGGTSRGSGCLGHYAVTPGDLYGPWAYMLIDGVTLPERVSQEKVKAIWDASRKAEAEARLGHVRVPTIGNGHGSDEALASQTLVLRVAPRPAPSTYNGVPIIERGRAWERFETRDGSRVWREIPQGSPYGNRAGLRTQDRRTFPSSNRANRAIQFEEGVRSAPRSFPRTPAASSGSSQSPSTASSSSSSSGGKLQSPRRGNKNEQ
ncbi:MAG: hypothetical protein KJO06_09005 [Gemmatimonadetes bacterium]|nr:hypothetical protein [Gemmatimonadota bacterium]